MRVLDIPPFPRQIEIPDLENFLRTRISEIVMWPNQAIPLLGAMCHPNDEAARDNLMDILHSWPAHSGSGRPPVPDKLGRIQADWLKVADIFHIYCDLIEGRHQERRGGPSIGKAIALVSGNARSWGTGTANLWKLWGAYKDVAHLVTAAALIAAEVQKRFADLPQRPQGLNPTQFIPFQMAMLMPDLVLAVAMEFERYGLGIASNARKESALDPETLWRIPADINVTPFPLLIRKLRPQDKAVLNNRRAGNRGRANTRTLAMDAEAPGVLQTLKKIRCGLQKSSRRSRRPSFSPCQLSRSAQNQSPRPSPYSMRGGPVSPQKQAYQD